MAFNVNPLMAEYAGISPGLKAALSQAGQAPPMNAPQITPQMKADAAPVDAGPAPELAPIKMPGADAVPTLGAPPSPNVHPPIAGTLAGDSQNRQTLMQHGPGVEHIADRIEGALPNHPILGKILGGVTQGAATLGDTLFHAALPGAEQMTPGTEGNYAHNLSRANTAVTQDENGAQKEAQTTNLGATTAHENEETAEAPQKASDAHAQSVATVGNLNSEAEHRGDSKDAWKELTGYAGPKGEPLEINEGTGEVRVTSAPAGTTSSKPPKENNPQQQTYDSLLKQGMTPVQAYEKIREKPGGTTVNTGTWALDEDSTTGKPVLFNSKTGETKAAPTGIAKTGTFAKKEASAAPVKQAMEYAEDYGSRTAHTGPGDEALMEKFFELAKPSTGFRMSQPQIDMLKGAQSWMGSMEAHLRHATSGTWFSDEQRKQIVDTMRDLGKAKGMEGAASVGGGQNSQGDMITVQIPGQEPGQIHASQKAAFLAKYPNAKVQ